MKKLALVLVCVLALIPTAFADSYKITSEAVNKDRPEQLDVTCDFDIGGVVTTETFPIFGKYDDAYIQQSAQNRLNSIKSYLPGGIGYQAIEDRKSAAQSAQDTFQKSDQAKDPQPVVVADATPA